MMTGVLNFRPAPIFRPTLQPLRRATFNGGVSISIAIRASANLSESAPTSSNPAATSSTIGDETEPAISSPDTFSPPPNFQPPEPKLFKVRSGKGFDILGAALSLVFRLGTGVFVNGHSASLVPKNEVPPGQYVLDVEIYGKKVKETSKLGPRPEKPIVIYEFESCPFCRKVREIVSVLDLDVLFYPCPKNGPNFRPKVAEMGGKQQFPYMVDPNTGVAMYESDDIIKYLVGKYGDGTVPFMLSLGLLTTLTEGFAMIGRMGRGGSYIPSKLPPEPLEIWAYEGSPFCKIVREVLVELELPHIMRCCARGSPKRQILYGKTGHFQVPYLEDPNTGVQMFESADIVEYLQATYAVR